ncbi:hypothetical protein RUND412_000205 [Rhizina undulata]
MEHSSTPPPAPLSKKPRLMLNTDTACPNSHPSTPIVGILENDNDADSELYDKDSEEADKASALVATTPEMHANSATPENHEGGAIGSGIPGLFLLGNDNGDVAMMEDIMTKTEPISEAPEGSIETSDPKQSESHHRETETNGGDVAMMEDTMIKTEPISEAPEGSIETSDPKQSDHYRATETEIEMSNPGMTITTTAATNTEPTLDTEIIETTSRRPPPDPEFLAVAAANKGDPNAEWQLDSDAESSEVSSSDSDSEDSDSDSDEEYTNMTPAQIAALLMAEDAGDGDDGAPKPLQGPLRTRNELPEETTSVEIPDVTITPEMKLVPLGTISSVVGTMVLIKAAISGDYQVLNEGSLICTEDRKILGTVADTFGRVEEPLYTMRYNSAEEIEARGVQVGIKVCYVEEHSTYVFTQPLKAMKGSDASNIHDEEVPEGEQEFSDDEQEIEHKRKLKEARRGSRGRGGAAGKGPGRSQESENDNGNGRNIDEPYVPLARPANLAEMMAHPPPPPASTQAAAPGSYPQTGFSGRGRGRGGRDRGRGSRGRGGHHNDRRHPNQNSQNPQYPQHQNHHHPLPQNPQQQPPQQPQFPQTFPFQFPLPQWPQQGLPWIPPPPPPPPNVQGYDQNVLLQNLLMSGAHVNPAFFSQGQQPPQASQFSWPQQQPSGARPQTQNVGGAAQGGGAEEERRREEAVRQVEDNLRVLRELQK